jgi:hypothetical protein
MNHLHVAEIVTYACIVALLLSSVNILLSNVILRKITMRINNISRADKRSQIYYNIFDVKTDP